MKLRTLLFTVLAVAAATATAQTYNFAGYVQHGHTYADVAVGIKTLARRGNLSIGVDGLFGVAVTSGPSAAIGMAVDVKYDAGRGWGFYAGPGIDRVVSDLSFDSLTRLRGADVLFEIGGFAPIDLSAVFGSSKSQTAAVHVIDGGPKVN